MIDYTNDSLNTEMKLFYLFLLLFCLQKIYESISKEQTFIFLSYLIDFTFNNTNAKYTQIQTHCID